MRNVSEEDQGSDLLSDPAHAQKKTSPAVKSESQPDSGSKQSDENVISPPDSPWDHDQPDQAERELQQTEHASPGSETSSSLAASLIGKVQQVLDSWNEMDHDNPTAFNMLCPNFSGQIDSVVVHGRENYIEAHRRHYEMFPNFFLETLDASIDIDERRGRAKLWMTFQVRGYVGNIDRASVNVIDLQRKASKWRVIRHRAIPGLESFSNLAVPI